MQLTGIFKNGAASTLRHRIQIYFLQKWHWLLYSQTRSFFSIIAAPNVISAPLLVTHAFGVNQQWLKF